LLAGNSPTLESVAVRGSSCCTARIWPKRRLHGVIKPLSDLALFAQRLRTIGKQPKVPAWSLFNDALL
jgi:hypothetical protein